MNNLIWIIIASWFLLGIIGAGLKIFYWRINNYRFNSQEGLRPIYLSNLLDHVIMGPLSVLIAFIEILLLLYEKASKTVIIKPEEKE